MLGACCSSWSQKYLDFSFLFAFVGERLFVPCETRFEGVFLEVNVLFVLILRSHDSGLVDDAFVCEASAVERAGAFPAIAWFVIAVVVD